MVDQSYVLSAVSRLDQLSRSAMPSTVPMARYCLNVLLESPVSINAKALPGLSVSARAREPLLSKVVQDNAAKVMPTTTQRPRAEFRDILQSPFRSGARCLRVDSA